MVAKLPLNRLTFSRNEIQGIFAKKLNGLRYFRENIFASRTLCVFMLKSSMHNERYLSLLERLAKRLAFIRKALSLSLSYFPIGFPSSSRKCILKLTHIYIVQLLRVFLLETERLTDSLYCLICSAFSNEIHLVFIYVYFLLYFHVEIYDKRDQYLGKSGKRFSAFSLKSR